MFLSLTERGRNHVSTQMDRALKGGRRRTYILVQGHDIGTVEVTKASIAVIFFRVETMTVFVPNIRVCTTLHIQETENHAKAGWRVSAEVRGGLDHGVVRGRSRVCSVLRVERRRVVGSLGSHEPLGLSGME